MERPGLARLAAATAATLLALALVACHEAEEAPADAAPTVAVGEFIEEAPIVPVPDAATPRDVVALEIEGRGTIRFELLRDVAPEATARFAELVAAGHYDGTTFHRILPGFMIQGGDPNSRDRDPRNDGQGTRDRLPDEWSDITHAPGIVALANRGRPNSADGQFFIMVGENRNLDGAYTIIGRVIEGQEIATGISRVERDKYGRWGPLDRPIEDVVMREVRLEPAAAGGGAVATGAALETTPEGAEGAGEGRDRQAGAGPEAAPAARRAPLDPPETTG